MKLFAVLFCLCDTGLWSLIGHFPIVELSFASKLLSFSVNKYRHQIIIFALIFYFDAKNFLELSITDHLASIFQ